jgi:hypothetical protein
MSELPPSIEYLRLKKQTSSILVWCDVSKTKKHREEQRDGNESYTVTTHLSGDVTLLGFYSGVRISADRLSMGDIIRITGHNRSDGLVSRPRYAVRFKVGDRSKKYTQRQRLKGPGCSLDAFDRRVLNVLERHDAYILQANRGGWTSRHVDLRGLECPWVPNLIKKCPQDPFLPEEWLPNVEA